MQVCESMWLPYEGESKVHDEREEIITYVSTYDMQRQSIKANQGQIKQSGRRDFVLNI